MSPKKLVLVSVIALLACSYPFLSSANRNQIVAGFPALYLYLSIVWFVVIVLLFRVSEGRSRTGENDDE